VIGFVCRSPARASCPPVLHFYSCLNAPWPYKAYGLSRCLNRCCAVFVLPSNSRFTSPYRCPPFRRSATQFAGLAPVPYAGLVLADWGASVTRIDRWSSKGVAAPVDDVLTRNKRSIALDISTRAGLEVAKKLIAQADVLLDPFRPGVLERLGLGPEVFLGKEAGGQREEGLNGRLVYARIAGYV